MELKTLKELIPFLTLLKCNFILSKLNERILSKFNVVKSYILFILISKD